MKNKLKNIMAFILGILPVYGYMLWYRLNHDVAFTPNELIFYPLVIGGLAGVVILLLNKYLLGKTFKKTFNSAKEPVSSDIVMGILLTVVFFILFFIEKHTIYHWFSSNQTASEELMNSIYRIADNPVLKFLWFGPTLWIGIAFFEEISRVFMLKTLWNLWNNKAWQIAVIVVVSIFIGILHLYQGTAGIISISIKSLLMGFYFYKFKRILPLIISHGLYDGLQFAVLMMQ